MVSINEAGRLIKRVILANVVSNKPNLAITPLLSGKHGIGKSAMIKKIAEQLGGSCITIEGGTLKEGEITGLPYQYTDNKGVIRFRFLPYYAFERIQNEEKRVFKKYGRVIDEMVTLSGDENKFSLNDLTPDQRIEALKTGRVHPVLIFLDEINRTENNVYRELMNILLTRNVNGYNFPWWVMFVGAMNPSTQNSVYATNDMDPAQLDRFLIIRVGERTDEWLEFGKKTGIRPEILEFIKANPQYLSVNDSELIGEEEPTPSPRGWDMVDTIISSESMLRCFFDDEENRPDIVEKDLRTLATAKLGHDAADKFFIYTKI